MGIANADNVPVTTETEITLASGSQRAVVSPFGALLRRYFRWRTIEKSIPSGAIRDQPTRKAEGDVLCPFPGRIAHGRYLFDGQTFQLDCNDKEGTQRHPRVCPVPFVEHCGSHPLERVINGDHLSRYIRDPWLSLFSRASAFLFSRPVGLFCQFNLRNAGTAHAPVGMGFHPYFTVGTVTIDEAEGADSGHALSGFGETLIPTGRLLPVQDSPWDCREFRRIGQTRFNHCYMRLQPDQDGSCRASLRNPKTGRTIAIGMDRAFTALVVNTGDDCEFAKAGIGHRTHDLFDGCLQPSCLGDCECCHPARRTPAVIRSSPAVRRSTPPILVLLCHEKMRRAQ